MRTFYADTNAPIQVGVGSTLLIPCGALHIAVAARLIAWLGNERPSRDPEARVPMIRLESVILAAVVVSHALRVYPAVFRWDSGALPGFVAGI